MNCPASGCDFETSDPEEMMCHIPTHEVGSEKIEFGYHVELYTNRHGALQITVGARDNTMGDVVEKVFNLYQKVKDKAESDGFQVVTE